MASSFDIRLLPHHISHFNHSKFHILGIIYIVSSASLPSSYFFLAISSLWHQAPQGQIVNHILDLLDLIFNAITPPPQRVILEVQQLEAGKQVLDELADSKRACEVAQRDRVGRKTRELLDQADEGVQVLLNGDMEGVLDLEVYGDWEQLACAVAIE